MWRGLQGAATLRADCGKIVIAVSDDIDPTNTDAVFWSLAYRANMGEDLHVTPYRSGGHGPKSGGGRKGDSTLMIDATAKGPMPPLALPARDYMEKARAIWEELGLPRLAPQPALARLFARRLGRGLGHLRAPRRRRHLGAERPRHLRAPPRRPDARDAGARGGEEGRQIVSAVMPAKAGIQDSPRSRLARRLHLSCVP